MVVCSLCTVVVIAQTFGRDLNGHGVDQLAPPGSRVIVFFFAASDCPISNRYIPEIERLDRIYEPEGVRFWWVYPNPAETPDGVRRHQQEFQITGRVILDTDQRITRMANATITPEAAVFVPDGSRLHEVYRGRIDDRYVALGQERPTATHHDLEDAIKALFAGQPVRPPGGPTVGCSIVPRVEK